MNTFRSALVQSILKAFVWVTLWGVLGLSQLGLFGSYFRLEVSAVGSSALDPRTAMYISAAVVIIILYTLVLTWRERKKKPLTIAGFCAIWIDESAGFVGHLAGALFFFGPYEQIKSSIAIFAVAFAVALLAKWIMEKESQQLRSEENSRQDAQWEEKMRFSRLQWELGSSNVATSHEKQNRSIIMPVLIGLLVALIVRSTIKR
jgi:hypothetical protein